MEKYHSYFDRQTISQDTHARLIALAPSPAQRSAHSSEAPEPKAPFAAASQIRPEAHSLPSLGAKKGAFGPARAWIALAACCALILGIGAYTLQNRPAPIPPVAVQTTPAPIETPPVETVIPTPAQENTDPIAPPEPDFVVSSPAVGFFSIMIPYINYQDIANHPQPSASRAYLPGSFTVVLDKAAIQSIFWGPDGIPDTYHTEIGRQDLPWTLLWDGYALSADALYDGQGQLVEIHLYGDKPGTRSTFALTLSPGHLPFTCLVDPDRETSDVRGTPVTGWSRVYDRDGDGVTDYICGSEFMTEGNVGVRFESRNSGEGDSLEDETWFNSHFVVTALPDGLHLDSLLTNDNIPAWEEASFETLAEARGRAGFAPYLPQTAPVSWSEFHGHLSYQEGIANSLFVRWTKMYDNVEICVYLPEDPTGYPQSREPVDVNVPESYDYRLYKGPISDSVPEQYRYGFFRTMFRAEDMSLEVVKARETGHDTGGSSFRFSVLHEDGVVVSYSCDRMTAEEVWALVEATL